MPIETHNPRLRGETCSDPVVGAILSGWRYDISGIAKGMRTDYEQHLDECGHCQKRQRAARRFDWLLILGTTFSIVSFLLMSVVVHKMELLVHIGDVQHLHLHHSAIAISLEAAAIAGLLVSMVLWVLIAVATPLPGLVSGMVQQKLPNDLRQRFSRQAQNRA